MEVMKNHGDFSDGLGRFCVLYFAGYEGRKTVTSVPNAISSAGHIVKHL